MIAVVALRLLIGWHFYQEGVTKIHDPGWTAVGFLAGSKGPLTPYFEMMVWDIDGRARLNFGAPAVGARGSSWITRSRFGVSISRVLKDITVLMRSRRRKPRHVWHAGRVGSAGILIRTETR